VRVPKDAVALMPVAEYEAFKAKVKLFAEQQQAQITAQDARIAELEEQQAESDRGRRVPPCKVCGAELACPQCSRAGGWDDGY
jgi:hypothetical protein